MNNTQFVAAPIITALLEVVKKIGMPAKFCPVVAIILGIAFAFVSGYQGVVDAILRGLVLGLISVGLYDTGVKPVKNKIKKTE